LQEEREAVFIKDTTNDIEVRGKDDDKVYVDITYYNDWERWRRKHNKKKTTNNWHFDCYSQPEIQQLSLDVEFYFIERKTLNFMFI
jgi:hypothetical protein